jgi:hypothetical protein
MLWRSIIILLVSLIGLASCSNENSNPIPCGNGVLDTGEQCDGDKLNGQSCETLDLGHGELKCTDICKFDPSECERQCIDYDQDNHDAHDTVTCPTGDDHCDDDEHNWTASGCSSCVDNDLDGRGAGCDLGSDCDDNNDIVWTGCAGCEDNDSDGHDAYDAVTCPTGDDHCDDYEHNWTASGCSSCVDNDQDGRGAGCDLGSDCDDNNDTVWTGCAGCEDNDSDSHDAYDAVTCPTGDDHCDDDEHNWSTSGCSSCVDNDQDGRGAGCDRGPDCDDNHCGAWSNCFRPPNGGFESDLTSWTETGGTVYVSSDAHHGSKAASLNGGASGAGLNSSAFTVYEGRRYWLSSQVKQTSGTGQYKVTIAWRNEAGSVFQYDNDWAGSDQPAEFTFHGGEFLAPETAVSAVIILGVQADTTCVFDDIGLELLDEQYEIWVTPDFRYDNNDFFVPNAAWTNARNVTKVFKFHIREFNDSDPLRDWIMDVDQMVTYVNTHDLLISLETAGTHGGDTCTAANGTGYASAMGTLGVVNRIVSAGGQVDSIMMDGPISRIIDGGRQPGDGGGAGDCDFTLQESVDQVVAYMQTIHASYPDIRIGLGVNFDHWEVRGYECFFGTDIANYSRGSGWDYNEVLNVLLPAVANAGEKIEFIIIDNPYEPYYKATHAPANFGGAALDQISRLRVMQSYCAVRGIPLGFMYNTADGTSDQNFHQETMAQLAEHEQIGVQFQIINPESWYDDMPVNYLPDTTPYTFMNLVVEMDEHLAIERD